MKSASPRCSLPNQAATGHVRPLRRESDRLTRIWGWLALCSGGAIAAGGCGDAAALRPGDVRVYTVPKTSAPEPPAETGTLDAIGSDPPRASGSKSRPTQEAMN